MTSSQKAQRGDRRVYTITVEIEDPVGNVGCTTCQVFVSK